VLISRLKRRTCSVPKEEFPISDVAGVPRSYLIFLGACISNCVQGTARCKLRLHYAKGSYSTKSPEGMLERYRVLIISCSTYITVVAFERGMPEQGGDGDEQLSLTGRTPGIDLGTETTPTVAEAPKKKSGVVRIPKKLAETSTPT
jgi:hypothetical protein